MVRSQRSIKKYLSFLSDFGWLVLSALGFSFALIAIRLYGDSEVLRQALKLQSYVIVISFLAQLGSRALVRRLIYSQKKHLTETLMANTTLVLLTLSPVGFLVGFVFDVPFYWCVSILLALNTLYLTKSVAERKHRLVAVYSVLNFIVAAYGGLLYLVLDSVDDSDAYFLIEALALLCIVFLVFSNRPKWSYLALSRFGFLIKTAQSYQLGSVNITIMTFFVMQSAVVVFSEDKEITSYADLQIASGFFSLLAGKLLLLIEKKIYQLSGSKFTYFIALVGLVLSLSLISAAILCLSRGVPFWIILIASWSLYSRMAIGYVVQYVSINRRLVDLVSFVFLVYFSVSWMVVPERAWLSIAFVYSFLYLAFGLVMFFKSRYQNLSY